jgi:uncharacterized protein
MFIFDNAVHAYNNDPENIPEELLAEARGFAKGLGGGVAYMSSKDVEQRFLGYSDKFETGRMEIEDALRILFDESQTDLAMAQCVPVAGYWRDFLMPLRHNYALKEAAPDKIVFCGAVDPNTMSPEDCVKSIEWQVKELDAKSIKFYQCGVTNQTWDGSDPKIAYPMYEKCLELGVKCIQFHKGFAFHHQFDGPWMRMMDLQQAAIDFPDLNFLIHHLGYPHEDEAINIIGRFENMSVSLAGVLQFYGFAPAQALHMLGKALMWIGVDRIVYGSEAFVWPNIQGTIDIFSEMQMPEQMQADWGYPPVSPEDREKMFGLNFARILDYDLAPHKKAALQAP